MQRNDNFKVVFVCTGNTCRSPMAEAIFNDIAAKRNMENLSASSVGLAANNGAPAAENAVLALKEMGLDLTGHRSNQASADMLGFADMIVCMTPSQAELLRPTFGQKVRVLGEGIPDPYGGDVDIYRKCRDSIIKGTEKLIDQIGGECHE